jgi:putative ATP-dependent endonuclease of the OLD family
MQILKVKIENFRSIKSLEFCPEKHNVFMGPNNIGKTAIVEAINLCLNPEFSYRAEAIDENDFFRRSYIEKEKTEGTDVETITYPKIRIDIIVGPISEEDDLLDYRAQIVPWNANTKSIPEISDTVDNPFQGNQSAVRICFEAQYDPNEDEFAWFTFFKTNDAETWTPNAEDNPKIVNRDVKRRIGFLIYRDVRAVQRPVNLDPGSLLMRVAKSQEAGPQNFERAFDGTKGSLKTLSHETNFGRVLAELRDEVNQFLQHGLDHETKLNFELTDRTREEFKSVAQLYLENDMHLPSHKYGAGTRSLITLSLLTYVMRKRGRGILALEEPETFLYPHAQRRVISEAIKISNQLFVTTHSPYILEQFSPESLGRVYRDADGTVHIKYLKDEDKKFFKRNLRKQLAEGLLSRGVLLTEEDSMAKWLVAASERLHDTKFEGTSIERFDLAGISAISSDGNGAVVPLGEFILGAGLPVLICIDKTKPNAAIEAWKTAGKKIYELEVSGLEKLLVNEIPIETLKAFVCTTDVEDISPLSLEDLNREAPERQKAKILEFLIRYKGSIPFQEWMILKLPIEQFPITMKKVVKMMSELCPKPAERVDAVQSI